MLGPARESPVALPGPAAKNGGMTGDIEGIGAAVTTGVDFLSRTKVDTGVACIDHGFEKAIANTGLLLYKVQANAYRFSRALIPFSLPYMWLFFPFSRRFHTCDHFVFVTCSISFILLLFVSVFAMVTFVLLWLAMGAMG